MKSMCVLLEKRHMDRAKKANAWMTSTQRKKKNRENQDKFAKKRRGLRSNAKGNKNEGQERINIVT